MGLNVVVRWASAESVYPGGPATPSQPWLGGPISIAPPSDLFAPNIKPPAQWFNYLFNKGDTQAQYAYNLAVSAAIGNWSAKTAVTAMGVSGTATTFGGFAYDPTYARWVGAATATGPGSVNVVTSADGGRTWTNFGSFSGINTLALALDPRSTANSCILIVDGGSNLYHAITGNTSVDSTIATTGTGLTAATAFWMDIYFWVFGVVQSGGTFTGYLDRLPAAGGAVSDQHAALPAAFASGTNHVAPLLSAVGTVGGIATAAVAICGTTQGTDTPKLMKMIEVAGVPTCTDVTASAASALAIGGFKGQITGLVYSPNDGLWGMLVNYSGSSNASSCLFTSPDLSTWTQVWVAATNVSGAARGLAVVGNVWALCVGDNNTTLGYPIVISDNVGSAAAAGTSTATFWPTSSNLHIVADGLGGLYSSGNQLLAATDTNVIVSLQVGFQGESPAQPFTAPIGTVGSSARVGLLLPNIDGTITNITQDVAVGFSGLTAGHQLTLPASPALFQKVTVVDLDGSLATQNFTVVGNGNNVQGASTLVMMNGTFGANGALEIMYFGATGWRRV